MISFTQSFFNFLQGLDKSLFVTQFAKSQRKETIEFLLHALSSETTYTPRGEYKEIMELCLIILGHPPEKFSFKLPGATHHARWMSKIIYSMKIFLFRNQFDLSRKELSNFEEICLFASLIYTKAWIQCPLTSDAPLNDLIFLKKLEKFSVVSKTVSKAAISKFENHLWYLGPEMVVLSIFSNNVPAKEKLKIIGKQMTTKGKFNSKLLTVHPQNMTLGNMKKKDSDWKLRGIRLKDNNNLHKKTLAVLIGCQSFNALKSFHLNLDFMYNLKPQKWIESEDYKIAKSFIDSINVVNDAAEKSMALITTYNESLTRNEDEKQLVLQVVEDHRKRVKNCKKSTLSTYRMR